MAVRVEKSHVRGWEGYSLSSEEITLGVVPEIGGRLISLVYRGEEYPMGELLMRYETFKL
ncbi:MAG: hypothetical protein WB791_09295 [Waddliaceae bacterium]